MTNLNNSLILLFLHRFDSNHIRQNNCQNTANQYLCQERYWPFYTSLLDMSFIEDCHSSTYWLFSTAFLIFTGKVALICTMTNLLDFPTIFIGYQHRPIFRTSFFFFYIGASFTTFLWFGIDSELDLFI